jgi:ferredoxin--NADP+ reductase
VHRILTREVLAPDVVRFWIDAPVVARKRRPGQFVIIRLNEDGERIPLTIADADSQEGTIVLVVQAVGKTTSDLVSLAPGCHIHDIAGPLGRPSDLVDHGTAVCVGGGVGAAVIHPIARALADLGVDVISVLGARSAEHLIFADELTAFSELLVCTDDGSAGRQGLVTDVLETLLATRNVDVVYAAGPVPMMRAVAAVTSRGAVRTIVSLNPIMVDGTGMCGGCRVTVGGTMRFACVDGPEFDAHGVDFDELVDRLTIYREAEHAARDHACRGPA